MIRLITGLLFFIPAVVLAADDPIRTELEKARTEYAEKLASARTKLINAMEEKLKEVAGKGDLDNAKVLKSQSELFEKEGSLPKSALLARARTDYESGVRGARDALLKALEIARVAYTKSLKLDEAEAIAKELKELADSSKAKPDNGQTKKSDEPTIVATWAHQVNTGKDAVRSTFKLYSNGRINSPDGPATWHIKGRLLTLRWPNPNAPGGAWEDVCTLSSDGRTYSGKNNKGIQISGAKLASGDINNEKKKK